MRTAESDLGLERWKAGRVPEAWTADGAMKAGRAPAAWTAAGACAVPVGEVQFRGHSNKSLIRMHTDFGDALNVIKNLVCF